jgi:ferric-dicitrate binding protein FerR (iron transport regulator)
MHYRSFSTEDFIQDEFFRQWVYSPNDERNHYWASFLVHYPAQHAKIEEARRFLLAMDFERNVPDAVLAGIKTNFNAAIDRLEPHAGVADKPAVVGRRPSFARRWYGVAASLLVVAVAAGYLLTRDAGGVPLLKTFSFNEAKTVRGEQRHLVLQDGTDVWLNANSVFRYPNDFSGSRKREVYLEGEAFFDVSHNEEKPFVVNAAGLSIKVLGTAFNVRSYAGDPVVETTLVRGKVTLATSDEDPAHSVTLRPNQKALFSKNSKRIALEEAANAETVTGWRNGWMIFDNKPFSYIKDTLERWYNVTIDMQDEKSLSCTFTARFKDKSLEEVLEIFRNTESINYWIDGDHVTINGRLCDNEN